jgi:ferrous iron transport protein A
MTLDAVEVGTSMTVLSARTSSPAVSRRLAELGIRPGIQVRTLLRTSGGGAVIALGDDRLAVSKAILAAVEVSDQAPAHG